MAFENVLGFSGLGVSFYGEENVIAHKMLDTFARWIEQKAAGVYGTKDLEVVGINFDSERGLFCVLVKDSSCKNPYLLEFGLDDVFKVKKSGYGKPLMLQSPYAEVSNFLRIDHLPTRELVRLAKGQVDGIRPILGYFPGEEDIERANEILKRRFDSSADDIVMKGPGRVLLNDKGAWSWLFVHERVRWSGHGLLVEGLAL